jgi:Response regulator containing a CheY-like receiver domain and an HTH DNA-binding domain
MDVDLPDTSGMEVTRQLALDGFTGVVLGLSMHDDPSVEAAMLESGARGFLSKSAPIEDLVDAVRRAGR